MKKIWMILTALLLLSALLLSGAAAEEPDGGSIPGSRTLAERLPRVRDVWDEQEAENYAIALWPRISNDPLPEGRREVSFDKRDNSYHFLIKDENLCVLYTASFLSNGVVQEISSHEPATAAERHENVTYRDGPELEANRWDTARKQIAEQAEELAPGILEQVEPLYVNDFRDYGDRQVLMVYASPLDPECDTHLRIEAVLYQDDRCELKGFSIFDAD